MESEVKQIIKVPCMLMDESIAHMFGNKYDHLYNMVETNG